MLNMNKRKLTQFMYVRLKIVKRCLMNRTQLIKETGYSYIEIVKKIIKRVRYIYIE